MFSHTQLHQTLSKLTNKTSFVIAYSGGCDSHVLLHAMHALRETHAINIQAVHVNHQLNLQATKWAEHCEKICHAFNIPLTIETISIEFKTGDSLEENARHARYTILKKYVTADTALLTAHNLNDQAETFLLQALRGAGAKGLSAMPVSKPFGVGVLLRPLLSYSRESLENYARANQLQWIDDDSNWDRRFRRNFLRHDIFPLLKQHYPAVMESFTRSARLLVEQEAVIAEIASNDYEQVACEASSEARLLVRAPQTYCTRSADRASEGASRLNLTKLRALSPVRQRLVLRHWFHQNHLRMPNEKHLKQIQKDVINAALDAHPVFRMQGLEIRRDRKFVFLRLITQDRPQI